MKKTTRTFLYIIGIVCFLMIVLYIFFSQKQDRGAVRIGYSGSSLNYGAVMVAYEEGFFSKHNVSVKMVPVDSGSKTRLGLAAGKLDMGFLNISDLLITIDAGAPVKILCPTAQTSIVVFVRPSDETKTFADFRGKNIQGDSGGSRLTFLKAVAEKGLEASDFNFVDIDKDYRATALLEQKVLDAIPTSRYNDYMYVKAGAVPLQAWEKDYGSVFSPHTYLAVNTNYAQEHQKEIADIIRALGDAESFMIKNPDTAASLVARHIKKSSSGLAIFSIAQILESWKKDIKNIIWSDPQEVSETVDFLYSTGQIKHNLSLDNVFDLRFENMLEGLQEKLYEEKN